MMSESEFGVRAVTTGNNNNGQGGGRSRSGSNASASNMRPLPAMPATMKATSLENESDATTSPTPQQQQQQPFPGPGPLSPTSTGSSNAPSANSRLTPSQRSRSSPYVPSPLNPMGPMSTSPPSGSTPPVSWRASAQMSTTTSSPLSGAPSASSSPSIIAPVPIKSGSAPVPPPPGAALPRVSSSSAITPNGGRGSMSLQKFASEEEELLNSGVQMPLKPRSRPPSTSGNRPASMVLYRLASDDDRGDPFNRPPSTMSLNPPNFRAGSISRFSTASQSPSVFSLSSDSKYPVFGSANPFDPPSAPFHQQGYDSSRSSSPGPSLHGQDRSSYYPGGAGTPPSPTTATQQGAFLPYEYDPAMDQDVVDDDDALHEPDPKGYKEGIGGVSGRGLANIFCLIILVLGLLSLFVVGPVIDGVNREAFARAQNQPQIIAGPVGAANTADLLTDTATSTDDPFGLGSITAPTATTSRSTTSTRRSTASTTATDENGDPIDPATVDDGTTPTSTRRGGGAATTATDDGTLNNRRDVRGRGGWAGLKLPRQTAR